MHALEDVIFLKVAPRSVRYLAPLDYSKTDSLTAQIIEQLDEGYQIVPPITLHLPNAKLMAGAWGAGRKCLVVGRTNRADRDLVSITAWASYTAAKRIASWLSAPDDEKKPGQVQP